MRRRELLLGLLPQPGRQPGVQGSILVHEHIIVDFAGADSAATYDPAEVFRLARPKLEEVKAFGCRRLLECTPNGLGRDPALLRRLSDATGIDIWTNTGLYGAAKRVGLPKYAWQETAEQLAKRWVTECKAGVTGAKPRFIKTGVNGFPLEPIDIKLVEAAALTSLETGLPIASHTNGGGRAMEAQLDILTRLKCPLQRFVWVHAQGEKDHVFHERAARAGAWCEFDGISEKSAAWHKECVLFMRDNGLLDRTLISQDAGWYHVGEPGGGAYRSHTYIYTDFIPLLPSETHQPLMVSNPLAAFGK